EPAGRYLSLTEREEISRGLAADWSIRKIAAGLQRAASTVSREIARYRAEFPDRQYRAVAAQRAAEARTRRPKARKLEHVPLRQQVQAWLEKR
ncbi:helix-turn-helix domain-containing protein, partial [Salmonella sp. s29873]|uniref:helix-turn-helix domain-containing protein n=1 Tax=Salmonella sp. s29873 TaxID=3159634 RepID=UPI00397EB9B1